MSDPSMVGTPKYDRIENDLYETPEWCTEAALSVLTLDGKVWESACGPGKMSRVLIREGLDVVSSSLESPCFGYGGIDFFKQAIMLDGSKHIFTNPPFGSLAEPFLRHALKLTEAKRGTVTLLLRNEFDSASGRHDLFSAANFKKKIVLTKRPRWIANTTGSPRHNFSWFHFDWTHRGRATLMYHNARKK